LASEAAVGITPDSGEHNAHHFCTFVLRHAHSLLWANRAVRRCLPEPSGFGPALPGLQIAEEPKSATPR
jgi:hypothetical protein